ncbi:MAG: nucleotide exchange factor GrpE [Bacteroidales bacterium]|nr:nucleotide exchange factor GrpE [Bacteroidales bacterium]MBD5377156.1 nucleotide exchange factor GrpE [Bacteroides sp.]
MSKNKNRQYADNRENNSPLNDLDPGMEVDDNVPEAEDQTVQDEQEQMIEGQENTIDKLEKDLADVNAALEKEKKEYLFLMAEFDNFRKRTVKEKADIIKNAGEKVLAGLLPIVDDFERGLEANRNVDDAETVKQGMELIYNKLVKYLEQNGVKAIESTGAEFNPDIHEAIAMVPAPDEESKGKVIDTPTKGYTLNDKVLRHAKVVVAQ